MRDKSALLHPRGILCLSHNVFPQLPVRQLAKENPGPKADNICTDWLYQQYYEGAEEEK